MSCCHYYELTEGNESIFTVDVAAIKYGPGAIHEVGQDALQCGLKRVALFTDKQVAVLPFFNDAKKSLQKAGVDLVIYDEVKVEPTDKSFIDAAKAMAKENVDGFISIGGGSVIDTCKAANLYATYPDEFLAYVNAPIGEGKAVPGALKPHIACPTTCGTGSECTGIAVFDLLEKEVKTGIASRALRPTRAVIDPEVTHSLPNNVVAASGFDVLSHALESYTARPYTERAQLADSSLRPMSQGANPYSDMGCRQALWLTGQHLVRAVQDADDIEARHNMMFAATLAGIAFGNSGVHVPHGMAYSVAGLIKDYRPEGYPTHEPLCPHGISVVVNAPAAFRFTAQASPDRHLEGAKLLGADTGDAVLDDAGEVLALRLSQMMQATKIPNGIGGVGYTQSDVVALSDGAIAQQRLLQNSPREVGREDLENIYSAALDYW